MVSLRSVVGSFFTVVVAFQVVLAYPWPVDSPRPLYNAYGDYQSYTGQTPQYYLHPAIDILKPRLTEVRAIQGGYVAVITEVYGDTLPERRRTQDIILCNGEGTDRGWGYAHLDSASVSGWNLYDWIPANTAVGLIQEPYPGQHPSHLHLEADSILTFLDVMPTPFYPIYNPLDSLAYDPDNQTPIIVHNDFLPVMDEAYGQGHRVFHKKDTINAFLVNHKVDFSVRVRDTVHQGDQVGIYRIYYEIFGPSYQGPRGFAFELSTYHPTRNGEELQAELVAERVYNTESSSNHNGGYLVSNTQDTTYLTNSFRDPWKLVGYWDTKHKRNGAPGDTAVSNAEAQFPDDFYQVKVTVQDNQPNTKEDTITVVVNNFPPQVKQSYPQDGETGVPFGNQPCTLRVWFDQPMDTVSVFNAFTLRIKDGDTVSGQRSFGGTETLFTFIPSHLDSDTVYIATIANSAKDIADSTMLAPYTFLFSTRKAVLLVSWCYNGTQNYLMRYDMARYDTLKNAFFYDHQDFIGGPVYNQRICYNRTGDNYVVHFPGDAYPSSRHVGKFSYAGESLDTYLVGRHFRQIATDGDTLFFLFARDTTDTNRMHSILKASALTGESLGVFDLQDVNNAWGLAYCPYDSLLYVQSDTLLDGVPGNYCIIQKYTKSGTLVAQRVLTQGGTGWERYITVNDVRVFMHNRAQSGNTKIFMLDRMTLADADTIEPYLYGPRGPSDGYIYGMTVDRSRFYATVLSEEWGYNWIFVADRWGQFERSYELTYPYMTFYGALAVYPSVLGTPGMYEGGGGGGDTDGGPQTDNSNTLLPRVYALGQSYPNPAGGAVKINYALPKESQVSLKIYNVAGQLVRTLKEGKEKPGFYKAEWDGKDQFGHRVSSGVYLYRMEAGEFRKTRKLVVVR